jgi:hypothetical protein
VKTHRIDLTTIPDEDLNREYMRRLNLRRDRSGSAAGGRPSILRPCRYCGKTFNVRGMREHLPVCDQRDEQEIPESRPTRRPYELVFAGAATAAYFPKRYRRYHETFESAQESAGKVREWLEERSLPTACHQAIVYGPDCGRDGRAA